LYAMIGTPSTVKNPYGSSQKVTAQVDLYLSKSDQGLLTVPKRYYLTPKSKSDRKQAQTRLQTVGA
ncbi:MAG: hypothetical protein AB4058_18955, partial [Microcystaceae cyanobacterium]